MFLDYWIFGEDELPNERVNEIVKSQIFLTNLTPADGKPV